MPKFQKFSIMVTNILEHRWVVLFVEGLIEPLHGWVKVFDPPLTSAIKRARHMEFPTPKGKHNHEDSNTKQKKSPQKESKVAAKPSKEDDKKLDFESKNELCKKLCFTCKEPWEPGHSCQGKGKLHFIEVTSDVDDTIDYTSKSDNEEQDTTALLHGAASLLPGTKYLPFKVRGVVNGQQVTCLVDSSATHNFVSDCLVARGGLPLEDFARFHVMMADRFKMRCNKRL